MLRNIFIIYLDITYIWVHCKYLAACSLELSAAYFQPVSSVFLSQQTSQQYFQPLIFSQTNRLLDS
jgi:hypothetical protein